MSRLTFALFGIVLAAAAPKAASQSPPATTTVLLVRHAEKAAAPPGDPGLTASGEARARALAGAAAPHRPEVILSTRYLRTRQTAAPLAARLGIPVEVVTPPGSSVEHGQGIADQILERHRGKTVLVVGHSNTVAAIIAALGGPILPDLCDREYANLFTLKLRTGETPELSRSTYGPPDPAGASSCAPERGEPAPTVTDARSLIRAMHRTYAGRWYRTISFTQKTTRIAENDSTTVEIWREWGAIPGRLRIEIGPRERKSGALFRNDSIYVVRDGAVTRKAADRNLLMLFGFDVYGQAPDRTLEVLAEEGFAVDRFHTATWQGRPAFVVGAEAGDLRSRQFWFDQQRLVFVRMIEPDPRDSTKTIETRFNRYQPAGGGWIAPEVEVLRDGRRFFFEEYSDIRVNPTLDPVLFDPERWTEAFRVHP